MHVMCTNEQRVTVVGKLFFTHTDRAVGYAMQCLGDKDLGEYTTIDAGEFRDWLFAKV